MSLPRYERYKDSGVEWIGEIPEGWEVKRLKRLVKILNGQDHKNVWDVNGIYPIIGTGGIFGYANNKLHDGPSVLLGRKGTIDRPQYIETPFWSVDTAYFTDIFSDTNPKFFYYICTTINFDLHRYGSAVPSMTQEVLNQIPFAVPSLSEQTTIASFLDRKTAEIDQLIANKEKLIALYEEEKTAIINRAVTKGLDTDVKTKPSSVDWLGKIPEHWEVKKVKFLLKENKGALKTGPFGSQLKTSDLSISGEYKVYTQRNVLDNDYSKGDDRIDDDKFESLKDFEVIPGDILITTRGTIGKCSMFPQDAVKGVLHPCLIRIQIDDKKLEPKYIINFFNNSSFFLENVKLESNSTVIDVIYGYTLKEIIIPLPPVTEQTAIVAHIETECSRLDTIIDKFKKQIELFKEYRTTLISEVVTGKIDVREEVAA